jgi:hypothetical protein
VTADEEARVREMIERDRWVGFKLRVCFILSLALMAHFRWSEGGLDGLLTRVAAVLFGANAG